MEELDISGEHQGKPILALVPKRKQKRKAEQPTPADIRIQHRKSENNMSQEENDLATHVSLCHLRYQQLGDRIDALEARLVKVEGQLSDLKSQTHQGFHDIKMLLERQNTSKQTTLTTTIGTIIVAVISVIGYLIIKH